MIFVTVGGQMPFDRLVRAVDTWAGRRKRTDVFAQIGETDFLPQHVLWTRFLARDEFRERILAAEAVVAHAGMGTIITALECEKPILVLPRRAALRETRNDHQFATAERLRERGLARVALDEEELARELDAIDRVPPSPRIRSQASDELLTAIRRFVAEP